MLTALLTPVFLLGTLALQGTPGPAIPAPPRSEAVTLDTLPIEQAAAARCAIAFATVGRWQKEGDARGRTFPDMATGGGREFFVRVMAKLMDEAGLGRDSIADLTAHEDARNETVEGTMRVKAIMPACVMMKSAAGL